jgi:hypothetical protein
LYSPYFHPNVKGTSGSIYFPLGRGGRGSLKGLLKFLEGKKFNTCSLLSTYFLTTQDCQCCIDGDGREVIK